MQSEGTVDLFFFQEYKWFCNKIWVQAFGLNGYLLTSVNEWPARKTGSWKRGEEITCGPTTMLPIL